MSANQTPPPIYSKHRYTPETLTRTDGKGWDAAERWMKRCDDARKALDDTLSSLDKLADKLKGEPVELALRTLVKETRNAQANTRT